MNNVGINTSAFANVVTPFSPVGKQAVGLENEEAKEEVFSPVEQAPTAAAPFNRETQANSPEQTDDAEEADARANEERVERRSEQQQQQQDQQLLRELSARDREVRAHEQAHASVGGQYAGAASFSFQRGPDGVNYAVGGEVPISLPTGGDPRETIAAAEQVRRAALAPADPSAQDRSVAALASQIEIDARAALAAEQASEREAESEESSEARTEEQREREEVKEQQRKEELREQQLEELRSASRRSSQLGDQLVTLDNVDSENNVGKVLDQLA